MSMHDESPAAAQTFERKVRHTVWSVFFERLWPRLLVIGATAGLFIFLSLAGLWPQLNFTLHIGLLLTFAAATLAAGIYAARTPWPSRDEALKRLEKVSGVPHRPASSYEDTLSAQSESPQTAALWRAHKSRLAALLKKLKPGLPRPRTYARDPFAIRILLLLGVVLLAALAGNSSFDRLAAAFDFKSAARLAASRLDAWVTPPTYTGHQPVMLADGGKAGIAGAKVHEANAPLKIPTGSILIVRSAGQDAKQLSLETTFTDGTKPETVESKAPATPGRKLAAVSELRYKITKSSTIRVYGSGYQLKTWVFDVIPDALPTIALKDKPQRTPRGSLKLSYTVADDYGIASASAKTTKAPPKAGDPKKAWARIKLTGPRPPLERPPVLSLQLPRAGAKEAEATTYLELGSHPWAGLRVTMTLEARDVGGQTGRSEPFEIVLPERTFKKPLARAVVEQRRKLVEDPRYTDLVVRALAALTLKPEGFIDDVQVYLGLRSAYYRLRRQRTRKGRNSVIEQLWQIALRIEDGDLSDAERRLRDAQDKLSKMLRDGATDAEIQEAMRELRQALNDFMQQLQRQAQQNPLRDPQGMDPNNQALSQKDLEQMMREIEDMARAGSREQAQQMLSQLRDMLERLQAGQMNQQQAQQNQKMLETMNELGNIVGDQQRLMDDTHGEQQRSGRSDRRDDRRGAGRQGQNRQGQANRRGQQGAPRAGRQQGRQRGEGSQQGQGQRRAGRGQQPGGKGSLDSRQRGLGDRLGQVQRDMRDFGMGTPKQLDTAREAMRSAERALRQGDLKGATREQARALEQLRQGAQQMAQQMLQQMPQRMGQSGDVPRDPLGRPQRSKGPTPGSWVKVPDKIDTQRAREILEELRRRLGEPNRPPLELDYIERLLRRF